MVLMFQLYYGANRAEPSLLSILEEQIPSPVQGNIPRKVQFINVFYYWK